MKMAAEMENDCRAFKFTLTYQNSKSLTNTSKNIPIIVVYPFAGVSKFRKVLENLLENLSSIFSNVSHDKIGLNITPRYNKKVSPLIYYAQGGGDFKEYLECTLYKLDKYWDKDEGYGIIKTNI
jgi:hypothetical protein